MEITLKNKKKKRSVLTIIAIVLGIAALAAGAGWLVLILWNALIPKIFGLPKISYLEGLGLFVLAHILFSGGKFDNSNKNRQKDGASSYHNSTGEFSTNSEYLYADMNDRSYEEWWQSEGEDAYQKYLSEKED